MRKALVRLSATGALALLASVAPASAQQAPPPPLQVPNPHYVSIPMEIAVNRPAVPFCAVASIRTR